MCPFRKPVVLVPRNLAFPSLIALCTLYFVLCTLSGPAHAGVTTRVSVASDGTQANGSSWCGTTDHPFLSADGRYIVFESWASNLVADDTNERSDVFVHDMLTGATTRATISSSGEEQNWANDNYTNPSISGDGRFVCFKSASSNLVLGDSNGCSDVFVHDRLTGQTERVSIASNGTQGNGSSTHPMISANGRCVVFASWASNLVTGDTNAAPDIFVRDMQAGTTTRVSVASSGAQSHPMPYGWRNEITSINADGQYVAFTSDANDLVPGDSGDIDVFLHDRLTGTTVLASLEPGYDYFPSDISMSPDGRYLAFNGDAYLFVYDRVRAEVELLSITGYSPSLSIDGRYLAFQHHVTYVGSCIWVLDRLTGQTESISVTPGGAEGNGSSAIPSISADGRHVAFVSFASDLVSGDTNGFSDVFVHDRWGSPSLPDLPITEFTLTPGTIGLGSSVAASVVAPGSTSARLRLAGLTRDVAPIQMSWNGSGWTATITGLLVPWASGDVLTVWADVFDATGRSGTACRLLSVAREQAPDDPGIPNAVWVDESNGRGIVTGEVKEAPISGTTPPPLQARISMDTVVTSLLGVDGSMNIWPEVSHTGAEAEPAADYSLGAALARIGFFSPSGGPAYDVTFNAVGDKAAFSAHFGPDSMLMTVWDLAAQVVAGAVGQPVPSAADLAETYAAFAELAPVRNAVSHLNPWPPAWKLPSAAALFAWDLSEVVRNDRERALLQYVLETLFRRNLSGFEWVRALNGLFAPYNMLKVLRDEAVWAIQTADGDPVVVFTAWHRAAGLLGVLAEGGGSGLVRPAGMDVSFDLAESGGDWNYDFTVKNIEGAALWEWRMGLDGDQPQPTNISAPPGWKWDIVWNMDERSIRWWTEGANGWAAGDFGTSTVAEGASLSGFSFRLPYRLQQCSFTAMGTDMRMDGGMLSMVPALSAAPPDFAPTEGETTELQAYLDRPATAALKIYQTGAEYVTVAPAEARAAGEFTVEWDGAGPDTQPAPLGDYEARLLITYADESTAEVSTPVRVITGLMVDSIGELRFLPDEREVRLVGKIVTTDTFGDPSRIYIQERSRCAGVMVLTPEPVSEGDIVLVSGILSKVDGERAIADAELEIIPAEESPGPLGIPNRYLGGEGSDIPGSSGLYNIGLLIRTWGKVTQIGADYLYIDDGSNLKDGTLTDMAENVGVRVICDPAGYASGEYVEVTGISSCFEVSPGQIARRILTRAAGDIQRLSP